MLVKKRIGLGTWSWGNKLFWNYQKSNDSDLRETFNESLKRGVDFFDTADSYGTGNLNGRSESLLGEFLLDTSSAQKNRIQIATKLAPYPWRIGNKGFNKPFLESLERLNNKLASSTVNSTDLAFAVVGKITKSEPYAKCLSSS